MPYLKIQTNQSPTESEQQALMQEASALVSRELGKSESYVMVALVPGTPMMFAANQAPAAYLEMKSIDLPEDSTAELSASLCNLISKSLNIDLGRIYIEFINAERHLWGWSGSTF